MTATTLLVDFFKRGITLRVVGDRLGVKAPEGVLTADLRALLIKHKVELLEIVPVADEYRRLLRDGFNLLLGPLGPSNEECEVFLDEQARLIDDLGPELASAIYVITGREWRTTTSVCPWCDVDGTCHEPEPRTGGH